MQLTWERKAELAEKELEKSCKLNEEKYVAPSENESLRERRNRKAKLNRLLRLKKGKGKQLNNSPIKVKDLSTGNETSTNCLHSISHVSEASHMEENNQGVHETSTSNLHSNPRVVQAARVFE